MSSAQPGRDAGPDVRPAAGPKDLEIAVAILEEAIAWASARGLDSWPAGTFAEADGWGRERLRQALDGRGLYLLWAGGEPAATFSLLAEDREFWPDAAEEALYFHRFAVRRAHAGAGAGALAWSGGEVRRRGRRYLRLDCHASNRRIRAYYQRAGFAHRGEVMVGEMPLSLYELDVPG